MSSQKGQKNSPIYLYDVCVLFDCIFQSNMAPEVEPYTSVNERLPVKHMKVKNNLSFFLMAIFLDTSFDGHFRSKEKSVSAMKEEMSSHSSKKQRKFDLFSFLKPFVRIWKGASAFVLPCFCKDVLLNRRTFKMGKNNVHQRTADRWK